MHKSLKVLDKRKIGIIKQQEASEKVTNLKNHLLVQENPLNHLDLIEVKDHNEVKENHLLSKSQSDQLRKLEQWLYQKKKPRI